MAWLLDTNVVSEMMRPRPEPRVARFLDSVATRGLYVSAIKVWEIHNAIGRLDHLPGRDELEARFAGILNNLFEDRMLDWTARDARECARIMEAGRRRGEPQGNHLADAMLALAASASRRGLVVVTRNTGCFRHAGVAAVDPWRRSARAGSGED